MMTTRRLHGAFLPLVFIGMAVCLVCSAKEQPLAPEPADAATQEIVLPDVLTKKGEAFWITYEFVPEEIRPALAVKDIRDPKNFMGQLVTAGDAFEQLIKFRMPEEFWEPWERYKPTEAPSPDLLKACVRAFNEILFRVDLDSRDLMRESAFTPQVREIYKDCEGKALRAYLNRLLIKKNYPHINDLIATGQPVIAGKPGQLVDLSAKDNNRYRAVWKFDPSDAPAKRADVSMMFHAQADIMLNVSAFTAVASKAAPPATETLNRFIDVPARKPGKFHYVLPEDAVKVKIQLIRKTDSRTKYLIPGAPSLKGEAETPWDLKQPGTMKYVPNDMYTAVVRYWTSGDAADSAGCPATYFLVKVAVP